MIRPRVAVFVVTLAIAVLLGSCGDDTQAPAGSTTDLTSSPATTTTTSTTSTRPGTSSTSTPVTTTSTPTTTSGPTAEDLVLSAEGLGVVDFGDEAESALAVLVDILGPPGFDTGWADPADDASGPLWPGCPGTVGRIVTWDEVMGVVFTDWDQTSADPRVALDLPYLAGAGLWPASPIATPDGARSGDTVGRLRDLYGDRLSIVRTVDGPVPWVFAIDGTTENGPLDRTGGLRGSLSPATDTFTDDSTAVGFTAGVSCDTP